MITQDELRAELVAEAAMRTPQPEWDRAMVMLGLLPEGSTSDAAAIETAVMNALAHYSDTTETITIVDRGAPMDEAIDTRTLAHELVHAIQDHRYDLSAFAGEATSTDDLDARRSVVEGDARFFELIYGIRQQGLWPERLAWNDFYSEWLTDLLDSIPTSTAPFTLARAAFPYWLGSKAIMETWRATRSPLFDSHSPAFVDALYEQPPHGVAELIDPALAGTDANLGCSAPTPPTGFEVVRDDALGPLGVVAFLGDAVSVDEWAAASDVRTDGIRVVADGTHVALVWRIRNATSPDRISGSPAVRQWVALPGHVVSVDGNDVVLVASDDAAVAAAWAEAVAHCP